jgi:hypothetical protein
MDPVKIVGIKNWPTPTKVKDVRSSWILQFLPAFYLRIHTPGMTFKQTYVQRHGMDMGNTAPKRI